MLSANAVELLTKKYAHKNETPDGIFKRVARALSIKDEKFEKELYNAMVNGVFLPNSPAIRNAGFKKMSLSACFVLPVEDSIVGIYQTLTNMASVFQRGGGVGINFSSLRPKDAPLATGGTSSGAVSFMHIFDATTEVVKSGGFRRGASMFALDYNYPNIEDFCQAKLRGKLTNANLSVVVSDDFMKAATHNKLIETVHAGKVYGKLNASNILDLMAFGAWVSGDPGILFFDRINKDNKLFDKGVVINATNPCVVGDTMVAVADGRNAVSIRLLAEEGKDIPVYCSDTFGKIKIRMMRHPRVTGVQEKVYKVTFDDGNFLRVTGNHKFILSDGTTKEAATLDSGDSVAILAKRIAPLEKILKHSNSKSSNYFWLKSTNSKNWIADHRLICDFYHGGLSWASVVHHVNYKSLENFAENLRPMRTKDHNNLHREKMLGANNPMRRFPEKNIFNNPDFQKEMRLKYHIGAKRSVTTKENIRKSLIIPRSNPEYRLKISITTKKWAEENPDKFAERYYHRALKKVEDCQSKTDLPCFLQNNSVMVKKTCEGCGIVFSVPWGRREQGYHDIRCWNANNLNIWKVGNPAWNLGLTKETNSGMKKISEKQIGNTNGFKKEGIPYNKKSVFNHKIVSVEFDGYDEVYNGTVDEFHNFYVGHFETTIDGDKSYCYLNNLQCGEIPIPEYGSCCLGSVNLSKFVENDNFNMERFREALALATRTLLHINILNYYPIPQVQKVMSELNPLGVGLMGLSDALIKLGIYYDSEDCLKFIDQVGSVYKEVTESLAPDSFYQRSIAPTGSLSIIADCSSGIEPVFSRAYERRVVAGTFKEERELYSSKYCRTAHEISPKWHLQVQARCQVYTDAGVSKSINCPADTTVADIRKLYIEAWKLGCKGVTVFRDGSIDGVYHKVEPLTKCDGDSCIL